MKSTRITLDLNELKKGGILKQRQKDYFILRTRLPGGYLKADMLPKFMQIAKKYGRGYVHLSTRQCIEIAWIHIKDLDKLKRELKKNRDFYRCLRSAFAQCSGVSWLQCLQVRFCGYRKISQTI